MEKYMFKNMKIGARLGGAFALVVLVLVSVIGIGYLNLSRYSDTSGWNTHTYHVLEETTGILGSLVNIETGQRGFLVAGKDEFLEPLNAGKQAFSKHFDKAKELTLDNAKQQERLAKLKDVYDAWLKNSVETSISTRRAVGNNMAQYGDVIAVVGSGKVGMDAMRVILADIDGNERGLLETRADEMASMYSITQNTLVMGGLVGLILASFFAFWVTRSIVRPLNVAVGVANALAAGDLTARINVTSTDETGQLLAAMQHMVDKLSEIITAVRGNANSLASSSEEISATAQSLSQSSSEQAASVEETTASIEQMTASIDQNTENAKVTDGMAGKAAREATEGGEAVNSTVEAMKKIAGKIGIVDDIAYQTNLLALNAAIEAARAGEHGKGFAVVAAEVRKLAERSQVAAQEIGELAGSSVSMAERAGKLLEAMVPSINKTSDLVQEIASASSEQASGVGQINSAMGQLNQTTQQNASASEELAATAEEMSSQAEQLQNVMTFFKLDDGASRGTARQAKRAPAAKPVRAAVKKASYASAAPNEQDFERF
jgi:methyl-accepting chemotaxis protein